MPLTQDNFKQIGVAGLTAASFSIVALLLMGLGFFFFKKQNFRIRMAMCLCSSVFLFTFPAFIAMCFFVSRADDETIPFGQLIPHGICQWQAFMLQWFMVSTDMWTAATAVYVYARVVHNKHLEDYQWWIYGICFGLPLLLAIVPFFGVGDGYTVVSCWCWIKEKSIRMLFIYVPAWLNFIVLSVCYILVIRHTIRIGRDLSNDIDIAESEKRKQFNWRVIKKLSVYSVVFIVVWTPASVNRIQNFIAPNNPIPALYIIHAFFSFIAGVLYLLGYGVYNKTILNIIWSRHNKTSTNSNSNLSVDLPTKSENSSWRGSIGASRTT